MTDRPHLKIALRTVTDDTGTWWVAFLTKPGEDPGFEIGRIRRSAVELQPVKEAFMQVMELTLHGFLAQRGITVQGFERHEPPRSDR